MTAMLDPLPDQGRFAKPGRRGEQRKFRLQDTIQFCRKPLAGNKIAPQGWRMKFRGQQGVTQGSGHKASLAHLYLVIKLYSSNFPYISS
jgi:hypothetical protein